MIVHQSEASALRSDDTDSIMTDEVEVVATQASPPKRAAASRQLDMSQDAAEEDEADEDEDDDDAVPVASTSALPASSPAGLAGTPATTSNEGVPITPSQAANLRPGPVCEFGDRLAYTYFKKPVPTEAQLNTAYAHTPTYWFTIDDDLTYLSFFKDTGPLNVGCLYRFCLHLHELLELPQHKNKRIILYSSEDADKKANAALLMALYSMVVMRWQPADALHPVAGLELQPFRDAGYARADYHLSLQDVLFGTKRAIDLRLLKLDEFNLQEYEFYEKVENGDWNYLTPNFLAFASPMEQGYDGNKPAPQPSGKVNRAFRNVLDHFEQNNIRIVVRLNKKLYNERRFTDRGIQHREMYFDDGTNPTMEMCREFIDLSEEIIRDGGVVAVHCKAGLGRTGTLIGAYLIYKYGFTASEVIGFMRIMRPGTCVGPQQHFMYENQMVWYQWGVIDRYRAEHPAILSKAVERPITPPTDDEHLAVPPTAAARLATPRQATPHHHPGTTGVHAHPNIVPMTVPGQPRKTPGAKTRHAVAAPETVNDDDVFIDRSPGSPKSSRPASPVKGRLPGGMTKRETSATPSASVAEKDEEMLAVDEVVIVPQRRSAAPEDAQPSAYVVSAGGIREITPPTLLDSRGEVLGASSSSSTSTATVTAHPVQSSKHASPVRPSRIAKPPHRSPQPRPLASISDNRQIDKIPALAFNDENEHEGQRARSRSASTVGKASSVLEDASAIASQGDRYNLRTAKSKESLLAVSPPSKLPKRAPGRRKAAAVSAAKTATSLGVGHPPEVQTRRTASGNAAGRQQPQTRRTASGAAAASQKQAAAAALAGGTNASGPVRSSKTGRRRRSSTEDIA